MSSINGFDLVAPVAAAIVGLFAGLLVWRAFPRSGKRAINVEPISCPNCQTPAPPFRKAANWRQRLWGGWTCARCGMELDKYGRVIEEDGNAD